MDQATRNAEIANSPAPVPELAEKYGLSRASIYRIRREAKLAAPPEDFATPRRNNNKLKKAPRLLFTQRALSGIDRTDTTVNEEFQRELQEDSGARIYDEMSVHPVVSAVLFAIRMAMWKVAWRVESASDDGADQEAGEFVDQCLDDMSQSLHEVISQIMYMLKYGFSLCETVYKKRLGQSPPKYVDDPAKSRFNDNQIGWRRWQFISPKSLTPGAQWIFDDYGRVQGVSQTAAPMYIPTVIDIERLLLFRTAVEADNPEGISLLRSMYEPWYYAKNLTEIEAIGAERLGLGFPVYYLGQGTTKGSGNNTDYDYAVNAVCNIRADEQMGLVIPHPKMGSDGKGALFELVAPPSRGLINYSEAITRHEQRMAMSALSQFIFLGMTKVGTQSLAGESIDLFTSAVAAWADMIADIINRFAIPRLMALNPFQLEELPRLVHSELSVPDLPMISEYINKLVGAMVITPYPELERHLLDIAGLPEKPEEGGELKPPAKPAEPQGNEEEAEIVDAEEGSERFALRLKRGGPKWERNTNAYQAALEDTWDKWADGAAGELAQIDDPQERQKKLDELVAAILAALILLGREQLPEAMRLGTGGVATSPEGLSELAQMVADNEDYLRDSLAPAIQEKVVKAIADDPMIANDPPSLRAVLGTFRARVGSYAGAFWALVSRGVIDWLRQQPDEWPVRQVLDERAKHCDECPIFAHEYANWSEYLATTGGRVPGQFQCRGNCRCTLEVKDPVRGWVRR